MYYVTYTECPSNYDTIGKRSDSMCKILFGDYLIWETTNISSFVRLVQFTEINLYCITKILRNDIFMTKLYATNISRYFVINILLKMGGSVLIVRK